MKIIVFSLLSILLTALAQKDERSTETAQSRIQELRALKKGSTSQEGNSEARHAQLELARLGQTEELQEIYCQLYSDSKEDIIDAGELKVPQVGGWFAIKSLDQMFDADAHFHKAKAHTNDLSFPDAHQFGLVLLPKLVPNPPFTFNDSVILEPQDEQMHKIRVWKQWISDHENELRRLEPTGAGVDYSPTACRNGKPRRKG